MEMSVEYCVVNVHNCMVAVAVAMETILAHELPDK